MEAGSARMGVSSDAPKMASSGPAARKVVGGDAPAPG